MASTSYTTGGSAVPAATQYGQSEADAVTRGATGAAGATSGTESTTDAADRTETAGGGSDPSPSKTGLLVVLAASGAMLLIAGSL